MSESWSPALAPCGIPEELAPPEDGAELVELCVVLAGVLAVLLVVELELLPPPQPATTSASAVTASSIEIMVRKRLV